jgi:hypothetical protein
MHDNAASRKSGNRTAYEGCVGSPLSHKVWAKNEAGSPKLGASTRARKLDSVELRERKITYSIEILPLLIIDAIIV